jgi:hypothetical protein
MPWEATLVFLVFLIIGLCGYIKGELKRRRRK